MTFKNVFMESIRLKQDCIEKGFSDLEKMGNLLINAIRRGNTVYLCGNGGSAADAQHLAAEMLVRLRPSINRAPVGFLALSSIDSSTSSACGNDYDFADLYARTLEGLGRKGDVLFVITTSGKSQNLVKAAIAAQKLDIEVIGLLGGDGGNCLELCKESFLVDSRETGRVQEVHITAGHALMQFLEDEMILKNDI